MHVFKRCLHTFFVIGLIGCSQNTEIKHIDIPTEGFHEKLSDYALFQIEAGKLKPAQGVTFYDVTNELFTDYAQKVRFIYLPENTSLKIGRDSQYIYPDGTVFVKNFAYDESQVKAYRNVETRLLIKHNDTWRAVSYMWDKEQSDASLAPLGEIIPIAIKHDKTIKNFDYVIPNRNQCKSCHNNNQVIDPLGFRLNNLKTKITLKDTSYHQLSHLVSRGIIPADTTANFMAPYEDSSAPIRDRALAYLDINCGHCHRENGPGNTSGLYLKYNETRTNHLGYCKGPVAAGKGSGGRKYDIYPGKPEASILHYRMNSDDPGIMMPELGRSLIHEEGVELIAAWIKSIDYDCQD